MTSRMLGGNLRHRPSSIESACWCRRLTPRRCAPSSSPSGWGPPMSGRRTSPSPPLEAEELAEAWRSREMDVPLELHKAPFRHFGASLAEYVTSSRTGHQDGVVIVVVPEVIVERGGRSFLHSHTTTAVRRALLPQTGVALVTVPFYVGARERGAGWSVGKALNLRVRRAKVKP
jgi:hypothetical protein